MRISDWSSDVCSSDLRVRRVGERPVPVACQRFAAVCFDGQHVPRRQAVDALPRGVRIQRRPVAESLQQTAHGQLRAPGYRREQRLGLRCEPQRAVRLRKSEEHTSELQSLMRISYAVFCLKKKTKKTN